VETYYLETDSPSELNEKPNLFNLKLSECTVKSFQFNKFLYETVGHQWSWTDKYDWSDQRWKDYAEAKELSTWVAYLGEEPVGYFELQQQNSGRVEIAYFGLFPKHIGKGFGGYLLSEAIKSAWALGASKVWVHTCSLDHPSALKNYQARGMKLFKTETSV
jgi:GNAT superfamily N-acetyltransferase